MKTRSFFLFLSFIFISIEAFSKEVQNIEALRNHVLGHVSSHYENVFGEEDFNNNVKIHVGRLDARLRLAKCDNNLAFKINEPPQNIRNITIKTTCNGPQRWTIYVPASIEVYANVLTAKHSMQKGHVLVNDDLVYKRINTAKGGHGHIQDMARAVGMELKRPLKAGDLVKLGTMRRPDIVRKGQTVIVTSSSRFLSVETEAIALVNGQLGESIKVKNERSKRVLQAKVIAPGKVSVALR